MIRIRTLKELWRSNIVKCWLLLLFPSILFSQTDTDRVIYLDSLEQIADEDHYDYVRILKNYYANTNGCTVFDYYKSGKLKGKGELIDKYNFIRTGDFVSYYENGNTESLVTFENNWPVGKFYSWYEKGTKEIIGEFVKSKKSKPSLKIDQYWSRIGIQRVVNGNGHFQEEEPTAFSEGELKNGFKHGDWTGVDYEMQTRFSEKYKSGKLISGVSIDSTKTSYNYTEIHVLANPQQGGKHFNTYINDKIKIPFQARDIPRGLLVMEFEVDKTGKISNVKIVKSLDSKLDEEAMQILKDYPQWNPGKKRGVLTSNIFTVPIEIASD